LPISGNWFSAKFVSRLKVLGWKRKQLDRRGATILRNFHSTSTEDGKPGEVVLAFTHSGESREILDCAELAKQNKVPIIVVTSYPNSSITKYASILLLSSTNEMRFHSDAVISRIIQLVIIDILQTNILLRLGEQGIVNLNKSRIAVAKKKT